MNKQRLDICSIEKCGYQEGFPPTIRGVEERWGGEANRSREGADTNRPLFPDDDDNLMTPSSEYLIWEQ